MNRQRGFLQALMAAGLFGAATPVSKRLLVDLSPQVLAGLFYLGAALCLLPGLLSGSLRASSKQERVAKSFGLPADRKNRLYLLGAVMFGGILGPILLLMGLRLAQASSVAMLLNLETVATAVLAWFLFREHLGRWAWVGNLGVVIAGVLLGLEGGRPGMLGGLLVAGAAVCWGLDNNWTALIDGITPSQSTFWKGLIAGSTNLGLGLVLAPAQPSSVWLLALLVGGLSYGASIVLYISAAQSLGAARSQMAFSTSPFFGIALAVLWLGESMSPVQWVAFGVIVVSLGLLFMEQHEHTHVHEALTHTHSHSHDDGHHQHGHGQHGHADEDSSSPSPVSPGRRHSHEHTHERLEHRHAHWPDLHHRHRHPPGNV